ncbi:methyltransferase [Mesorhizobium sp. M0578]|uniref:methyltransferase n=1 Tax=unclassified Mesorhizobium TaxID=325217 RepID=UPI0033353AF3
MKRRSTGFSYGVSTEDNIIRCFDMELEIHDGVFWKEEYMAWRWLTEHLPQMNGKQFLEIGTGIGVTALYAARSGAQRVVAVDINPNSVKNARANAEKNNVRNIDIFESDIFSAVGKEQRFDYIYWSIPGVKAPGGYVAKNPIDLGVFDPDRKLLRRFYIDGQSYLANGGQLLLGFIEAEPSHDAEVIAVECGLDLRLLASREASQNNEKTYRLYSLKPKR